MTTLVNVRTATVLVANLERFETAMLTAYFDESGIHKGDHLCVVAGFVGNDAQWLSFIHNWIAALKPRPNLPVKFIWGFEV